MCNNVKMCDLFFSPIIKSVTILQAWTHHSEKVFEKRQLMKKVEHRVMKEIVPYIRK